MYSLIDIEKEEMFVSLDTIVKFTGNAEGSVKRLIRENKDNLAQLGLSYGSGLWISNPEDLNYSELKFNEDSSTYLITLMANSPKVKRKGYAHPRHGDSETITRIINDYQIEIGANDLNMFLVGKGLLKATPKKGFDFHGKIMCGNTPLLHVDTILKITDENNITRGRGYSDLHQTLF